jgi:PAS domain S-box-containing protein
MKITLKGERKPIKGRKGVRQEIVAPRISETRDKRVEKELRRYREELEALAKAHPVELFRGSSKSRGRIAAGAGIPEELLESDPRLAAVFECASEGVLLADLRSKKFVYGNSTISRMLGYAPEEIKTLGVKDIHPKENLPQVRDRFERLAEREITLTEEIQLKRKDGSIFYADITSYPIKVDGRTYVTGIFRDVTGRRQAEEDLRKSEGKFRAIFENTSDGIFLLDLEARKFFMCNTTCAAMLGYTQEEFSSLDIADIHPRGDLPFIYEQIGKFSRGEHGVRSDIRFKRKDGSTFVADLNPAVATIAERKYLVISFRDITERKRAEESLWEKERAIESSINGIAISDLDGKTTYANAACLKLWGYTTKAEVLGQNAADFWREPKKVARIMEGLHHRKGWFGELTAKRNDGSTFEAQVSASRVVDKTGKPISLLAAFVDITGQKRAEENYRGIFENAVVGIYQSTPKGKFLTVNPAFARILGYKCPREITGMASGAAQQFYAHKSKRRVFEQLMKQHGEVHNFEFEAYCRDGRKIWIKENARVVRDSRGRVAYYEGFVEDITARKDAEESLKQAAQRIIEAQEAERKRVACGLHDGPSQLLSSAKFRLASASDRIQVRTQRSYPELDDSQVLIEKAVQEIRRIIRNLRPAVLDNLGLLPALRTLCEEFRERTNVKLDFRWTPKPTRLAPQVELALFRIVQEALNNIEKHARATRVTVSLVQKQASLRIKVKDNGVGFDHAAALRKNDGLSGYGLHTMMDRTASIGGDAKISSATDSGTEVIVRIPLNGSGRRN